MKSKAFAILLIVLGVGATLGGLYGQIFLADDEGHHDDRAPTFALQSQFGADELSVEQVEANTLAIKVERADQPLSFGEIHGNNGSYFLVGVDRSSFVRADLDVDLDPAGAVTVASVAPGQTRVVAQVAPSDGPDLLELGVTVDVSGEPVEPQNVTDTDEWTSGSVTVRRESFDFVLSEAWNGDDVYDGPALLTLFRPEDSSFSHAHAEVVGTNRFSFGVDLAGLGDYLAALEFEQDGELVTALFRFTL